MKAAPVKAAKKVKNVKNEEAQAVAAMNRNGIIAVCMAVVALILGIIAKSI